MAVLCSSMGFDEKYKLVGELEGQAIEGSTSRCLCGCVNLKWILNKE
jgi:hypothetical protein